MAAADPIARVRSSTTAAEARWAPVRAATAPARDAALDAIDRVLIVNDERDIVAWRVKAHVALGCRCAGDLEAHA